MKKQPKPKPCEWWGIYTDYGTLMAARMHRDNADATAEHFGARVVRVRIVPVAPKKRAKAKRGGK